MSTGVFRLFRSRSQDFEAVEAGEQQVEHDRLVFAALGLVQPFAAVGGLIGGVALLSRAPARAPGAGRVRLRSPARARSRTLSYSLMARPGRASFFLSTRTRPEPRLAKLDVGVEQDADR